MRAVLIKVKSFKPLLLKTVIALSTLWIAGCGSPTPPGVTSMPTSGIKKRVLLSNQQSGSVLIMDASKDTISNSGLTVFGATRIATNGGTSAVISSTQSTVGLFDDTKEQAEVQPTFPNPAQDIAVSTDGKTLYAAVRNSGFVAFANVVDGTFSIVNVPSVSRLVLSPNGTKLLAFSDDPQSQSGANANAFIVIDTASKTATVIAGGAGDQPFTGVFNNSETKAFILNCGKGCGGTAAPSVVQVDFSGAPVLGTPLPVASATVGLLNSSTLFVAGTDPNDLKGKLQAINTGSMSISSTVTITDGLHTRMKMANDNKLYIGASACTTSPGTTAGTTTGCLSIVNTSSNAVTIPAFARSAFDVTGIQPISNRSVVYVCEGGELDIFDTTNDTLTPTQIDVVGKAFDVLQIDP